MKSYLDPVTNDSNNEISQSDESGGEWHYAKKYGRAPYDYLKEQLMPNPVNEYLWSSSYAIRNYSQERRDQLRERAEKKHCEDCCVAICCCPIAVPIAAVVSAVGFFAGAIRDAVGGCAGAQQKEPALESISITHNKI